MKNRMIALLLALVCGCGASAAGQAGRADEVREPPFVLPAIRQWTDLPGTFPLSGDTVISDPTGTGVGEKAAEFFRELCGVSLPVVSGGEGSIVFEQVKKLNGVTNREEGYALSVRTDRVTVRAETYTGLLYGAVTLAQMCWGEGEGKSIRCGDALDEPAYPVRTGLVDVARAWIPLEDLTRIAKYMAWFKLNEIHVHLTDNSAFRLESDVPGLSSVEDGEVRYYGKDEYRAFQKEVLSYGIRVVNEIDTPAHCRPFGSVTENGPVMMEPGYMDLSPAYYERNLSFVQAVWDEYLTGDDPVFLGPVVSIGTDEYRRGGDYDEQMCRYTADLAAYVKSRGYTPSNWAFLGPEGFPGETAIPTYVRADMWDNRISGLENLVSGGYDMVNMMNSLLYIVPAEVNGFHERMDIETLYRTWQVWIFNGAGMQKSVEPEYSHLLGAGFSVWNDYSSAGYNFGITKHDIIDRVLDAVCLISEKTWDGKDTENGDVSFFLERTEKLGRRAGSADPGYHALEEPLSFGLGEELPAGFAAHGNIENGKLILDGDAFLSYDRGGVGFPNTLTLTLYLEETPEQPLLSGADISFYADADGKGHAGYVTEGKTFLFDCPLPLGIEFTLTLTGDGKETLLLLNGTEGYEAKLAVNPTGSRLQTLVLPLSEVGKGAKGYLKDVSIAPAAKDFNTLRVNSNLALNRPVTVSGTEVPDNHFPEYAVDGKTGTRVSFARDRDEQWMVVDLGRSVPVARVEILFHEHVLSYGISLSEDGKTYRNVYEWTAETAQDRATEGQPKSVEIRLGNAGNARYVRYEQHKRWHHAEWDTDYSGGIEEFRVFSFDESAYRDLLERARAAVEPKDTPAGVRRQMKMVCNALESYLKNGHLYRGNLDRFEDRIADLTGGEVTIGKRSGDLNGDGRVSAADALRIKRHALGNREIPADEQSFADVNADGQIDGRDVSAVRRRATER